MEELSALEKFKVVTSTINSLRQFDGDKNCLVNFINSVERLIPICDALDNSYKLMILGLIKDKITGKARQTLLMNGDAGTWAELRTILIRNHGENTSIDTLVDQIRTCRCDNTIENFYQKLNNLLCRLNNAYLLDGRGTNDEIDSNKRIVLHSFKFGLPEPVKSIIISRNPTSLSEAYEIIRENGYLNYTNFQRNNSSNNNPVTRPFYSNNYYYNSYHRNGNSASNNVPNNNHNRNYNQNRASQIRQNSGDNVQNRFPPPRQNLASSGQSRFSQNSRNSQNRQFHRLQSNNNYSTYQNNNNSRSNDTLEPMEISINESQQNFRLNSQNNYPI